ncbi:MAG: SDR family oxidoreductase, partial [Aliarcobacter sp.]|nr:SDR family oxidoreductase [Aliarcobacter sp.]MBP9616192.1 SDR family oxidoreductase [Aliarcobacter sp.]
MKVLLTGSSGYIGRRLKQKLLQDENIELRLLVRNKKSVSEDLDKKVQVFEGDTFNVDSLKDALKDV